MNKTKLTKHYINLYICFFLFASIGYASREIKIPAPYLLLLLNFIGYISTYIITGTYKIRFNKSCIITSIFFSFDLFCLFIAYRHIDYSIVIALHYTAPIIITIISPIIFKNKFTIQDFLSSLIGLIGVFLIIQHTLNQDSYNLTGLVFSILSGFSLAANIIASKITANKHSDFVNLTLQYNFNMFVITAFIVIIWEFVDPNLTFSIDTQSFILLIIFAFLLKALGSLMFNSAIRYIPATSIGQIAYTEVFWACFMGISIYQEKLHSQQIIGTIFIVLVPYIPKLINSFKK